MDPPKQAVCRISGIFGQIGGGPAAADFTQYAPKGPPFGGPHREMVKSYPSQYGRNTPGLGVVLKHQPDLV